MIDHRNNEKSIVNGLEAYLSKEKPCKVIRRNQTAPIPDYPYSAYTITTSVVSNDKGYCEEVSEDGKHMWKELNQIWSFTFQSDDDEEARQKALEAWDWLSAVSDLYLSDLGIVVVRVGNVTNRDTMLTIEYEHRYGFDVTFRLVHEIEMPYEIIETAEIKEV